MKAQGLPSLFDTADLSIIGIASIPRKLPLILRRIRETVDAVVAAKPDALIIIDSPDFTHRVARRVRKAAPQIPIVNYAPPSVWAWRPWRARAMRRYVDEVLAILPFEPAAFARLGGPHCTYVGHPLAERIGELRPEAGEARRRNSDPPVVLVLPGSRGSEIRRLAGMFGAAIAQGRRARRAVRSGAADVAAHRRTGRGRDRELAGPPAHRGRAGGKTRGLSQRARGARRIRHRHARARARAGADGRGLSRPGMGGRPVPDAGEHRHGDPRQSGSRRKSRPPISPERLHARGASRPALVPLLGDTPERRRQLEAFARLDTVMDLSGEAPSARAARAVLALIEGKSALPSPVRFMLTAPHNSGTWPKSA